MTPQMKSLHDIRERAGAVLSLKVRVGYVALLLVSVAMTVIIASLWLTESALPPHTHLAFGAMCVIGASWSLLSLWALRARRPLFARDRLIAGRLAVTFTSVFAAAGVAAVTISGSAASYVVLTTGVVMLVVAIRVLVTAARLHAQLQARRVALEGAR